MEFDRCHLQHFDSLPELRRQIARHLLASGVACGTDDLVVTAGGLEGVNLALRATCKAGDVIAVESPTYFGVLQAADSLGLKVAEVPSRPVTGFDVEAFAHLLARTHVRAVVVMATCHNPLGSVMPDAAKAELVSIAARHGVVYVHLVVFAIDLDRVRETIEDDETAENLWPFGFEVFLTEMHLAGLVDPTDDAHADMLDDLIDDLLETSRDEVPFGSQLAFAIHDAVLRGSLPETDWRVGRAKSLLGAALAELGAAEEARTLVEDGYRTLAADPRIRKDLLEEARARAERVRER